MMQEDIVFLADLDRMQSDTPASEQPDPTIDLIEFHRPELWSVGRE